MTAFQSFKLVLLDGTGLSKDALHIYVGLAVLLTAVALRRSPIGGWKPWATVAAIALLGEAWDLRDARVNDEPINLWANWHDVWNTLFWPTVLMLLARHTRLLRR